MVSMIVTKLLAFISFEVPKRSADAEPGMKSFGVRTVGVIVCYNTLITFLIICINNCILTFQIYPNNYYSSM